MPWLGGLHQTIEALDQAVGDLAVKPPCRHNNRLLSMDDSKVRFRWKDYRDGNRQKTMTLDGGEFIRRFLIHVLPDGFHRIRYFVSAQLTAHSMLRRDGTGMVSTINEVDTTDERSLKPFET